MPKNFEQFRPINSEQILQSESEKQEGTEIGMSAEEDLGIKRARGLIARIFEENEEGSERVEVIIKRLDRFLESNTFNNKQIKESLIACSSIEDKEKFIGGVMSALEPIIAFRKANPETFAQMSREAVMRQEGMKPINEILYYGERDDYIHIHLAPAKDLGIGKLRKLALEGFQKLAEVIKNDEQIREISATSWIVAHRSGAKLMEKLGFELQGEIEEDLKQRHFSGDERKISKATISREEFLKRYLK